MTLPVAGRFKRDKDEIIVVDVGSRMTKAVALRRDGPTIFLLDYSLQPTPEAVAKGSVEALGQFLGTIKDHFKIGTNRLVVLLGMNQALLRHADVPIGTRPEIRGMLKLNPRAFLQQELASYQFDCHIPPSAQPPPEERTRGQKMRVLVGGTRLHVMNDWRTAANTAGLKIVRMTLTQVGVINATLTAAPPATPNQAVALVEIG